MSARVAIVGAGISGAACANVLAASGISVGVLDRGRAPGGRMASPTVHGRRVDLGAAYFTVKDPDFAGLVDAWAQRGLAREWTDTFDAYGLDGHSAKSGPARWAASDGLRSLVRDLLPAAELSHEVVDLADLDHDAVVLAMPDPQAARMLPADAIEWVTYEPVIAVALGYERREWSFDAAFVNDDPDLTLIADDGSRRGDGAAVLVAHTTSELASQHLADPSGVGQTVADAVTRLLGLVVPSQWTYAHRWTFAKPAGTHGGAPYGLVDGGLIEGNRLIGLCNDSWCPEGSPRVESAWLSGRRLGIELANRLT
ncbi:NAD(P)/FAD-dependent oxidoreductase [uncultured Jatrophihabitans sp.]|uniref:NAD(P)/FAD-dependent oxidoreductase n=1 Tax=uncultured Jatrophihabitans sp. TaxID=1610747 RepID=UPI0035C9CD11